MADLAKASYVLGSFDSKNPWSPTDYDRMDSPKLSENFKEIVKTCRFFYTRDPLVSTTITKLVDIGITDIVVDSGKLGKRQLSIIQAILPRLKEFARAMALEYLLSGLVIPEIEFSTVGRRDLRILGILGYSSLTLPTSMWIRDPATIEIKNAVIGGKKSYFVKIPAALIYFINSKGKYLDGSEDKELYNELVQKYPEFVSEVKKGNTKILLQNDFIINKTPLADFPYPVPYLYPVLESLKHKRNLRRMDYSIASRVVSAIQLFKVGNDQYPVTEDNQEQLDAIREQMRFRQTGGRDVERVFQLFTNHTVSIEWVFPPVEALLDDKKYAEVNEDIFYGLGFPRVLVTGETKRSGTSDPEYATISPIKTMEAFRDAIIKVLRYAVLKTLELNGIKAIPAGVRFTEINLHEFKTFIDGLFKLYEYGNLSRSTLVNQFGFNIDDEFSKRKEEDIKLKKMDLNELNITPYSSPEFLNRE